MLHVEISYSGTDRSPALDDRIREQVARELARFEPRLTRVEAHLADTNAAKGGVADKACTLEARPRGLDPIVVKAEGADLYGVVGEAAGKLARALATRFEKLDAVR